MLRRADRLVVLIVGAIGIIELFLSPVGSVLLFGENEVNATAKDLSRAFLMGLFFALAIFLIIKSVLKG